MLSLHSTHLRSFLLWNYLLSVAACALGTAFPVLADGTKEFFSDWGLYSGDPPGSKRTDIYIWSANNKTNLVDALSQENDAPEGKQVAKTVVDKLWGGWGIFNVITNDTSRTVPLDCSDYEGGALRFWLKSQHELLVQIEYVYGDAPSFHGKVGKNIPSTDNHWVEVVIPLSDFPRYPASASGLNLRQIIGPFLITTSSTASNTAESKTWYVDHVRWTKPVARLAVFPPKVRVNPGMHRQFTVEGLSSSGETVIVNAAFSTPREVGTLLPAAPTVALGSVLTANQTSGNVTATFTNPPTRLSATAVVEVTQDDLNRQFGLLSDTRTSLDLSTNSKLLTFYGGPNTDSPKVTNHWDSVEGTNCVKTTVYHLTTTGYSGWTVIWGTNSLLETETKDMSDFYDGALRFWLKAPHGLQSKLQVGIRSGNVPAGSEASKVSLDDYATFDNRWHEVSVPIKVFAGSCPLADLSRLRCFFTIAVVGKTSGEETFLVDDVRWDTEYAPPPRTKGDYNGDDRPDIIFQDSQGFLAAWLMNGTNMISARLFNPNNVGNTNWMLFDSGLFNSDAKSDLGFQHTDGTLAAWFMDGTTMASAAYFNPHDTGDRKWRVTATGDLNRDGDSDFVFQHQDGTLAVWYLDGINISSTSLLDPSHPGDVNWRVVGTGDFNQDGQTDLVLQHTNGRLAVWLMKGARLSRGSELNPPTPGDIRWRVVSTVDRNQDGKADLLFQHSGTSELAVWFMNGTSMQSAQFLNPRNPNQGGGSWRVVGPK